MCLILLAHDSHPRYRLVLAANRDEFHERPTAPATFWPDAPEILAGRDLRGGGTWMGVTRGGRIAAVTNYRTPMALRQDARSRGALVRGYLEADDPPGDYVRRVHAEGDAYNPFALLTGTYGSPEWPELWVCSNRDGDPVPVAAGLHGLSNHLLDTRWPKVERGRRAMQELLTRDAIDPEAMLAILQDRTPGEDEELPDTGVGLARERALSPIFIVTPTYGTRCATALLIGRDGRIIFVERSYTAAGETQSTVSFEF